jgi:hypothetical protein
MSENNGSHKQTDFPSTEEFIDFCGRTRRFAVERFPVPSGHGVCLSEDVEGDDGYVFQAFSTVDPFHALGELRGRIRKLLSVRHLVEKDAEALEVIAYIMRLIAERRQEYYPHLQRYIVDFDFGPSEGSFALNIASAPIPTGRLDQG